MNNAHSSPSESTLETSAERSLSTFDRALKEYLDALPKDKKRSKFIELCRDSGKNVTPQGINKILQEEEARRSLSGPVKKVFKQLMRALTDYNDIIGQMASVHPMVPSAIIWGALKVVIQSSNRCDSMFESMHKELLSLAEYLQRITVYEDLYGDSKEMQGLLFNSYANIIHFWHRVHKECKHKGLATVGRAMTSSALNKMNSIISEIHSISDNISKQASLCQGQKDREEYTEAREERKLQSEWRQKQSVSNYFDLCKQIRDHLSPPDDVARPNSHRHESNLQYLQPESCQWLIEESRYTTWCDPKSEARRFFCLSGPAGYGKSFLTSFAIRDLESKGAAVAYYFCQFSQPCENPAEILRLLALQLFDVYFSRKLPLDEEFGHHILKSRKQEHVRDVIHDLVSRLLSDGGGVYFFIDGLDEATAGISHVFMFLNDLHKKQATREVGLWVSKRRQARLIEYFEKHVQPNLGLILELADHTEADVVRFLRGKLHSLKQRFCLQQGDLGEKDRELFRLAETYLISHAQGNFLWAWLMTRDFDGENRVEDVKELLNHLNDSTPKELADLYKGYFDRFGRLDRDNMRVAIKVMSLVAFARRPLRLEELQVAAAILASHRKKNKAASEAYRSISTLPLKTFMARYTTLVEVDGNASDPTPTDTCRLVHSSVLEFLIENPAILDKDSKDHQLHISPFVLANACLIYLNRPVYAKVLRKQSLPDETWIDSTGETVDKQVFSQYAAKYWVRHLGDLEKKEQDQIRGHVEAFVSSNNFQTCMQIQSIWVQGRFDVYRVEGSENIRSERSLLRPIPEWLIRTRSSDSKRLTITKYWSDYLELMHDWRMLLSCGNCHDSNPDCFYLAFRGESDRIWWTTLGPDHLFSNFQGRYKSFRLAEGKGTCSEYFEALNVSKEQIVIVRLVNWNRADGSLQFVCEHWTLSDHVSAPTLEKKQVIMTTEAVTNWLLYAKPPSEGPARLVARPTALSGNAQILRLGAQLFRKDEYNEYCVVSCGDAPAYFEEVSGRGALVVIGSRSHTVAAQLQEPYLLFERFGKDFTHLERLEDTSDTEDDSSCIISDESDDEWLSEASSDSSDIEMETYESWSEGSTDEEGYDSSDSEKSTSDVGSEAEPADDSSSSSSGDESDPVGDKSDSGDDTPSVLSLSEFPSLGRFQDSDDEEELWAMEVDAQLDAISHGRPLGQTHTREPTVLLTALQYDDNSTPIKLFEYSSPLRFMLYDSPPAVHPHKSLVVWPLGGGDLLFADVASKTYFTRQLRPSASHTRQISVKLQFSPCGRFLHAASLEVRVTAVKGDQHRKKKRRSIPQPLPDLHLYMLVLTYRLSTGKPTRSPPVLIHRIKVDLGKHEGQLSVSQLPFIFTWTPCDVFVSRRGTSLDVFRIQLFSECTGDSCRSEKSVLVPTKKTLLPDSAALRDVYFVPLSDDRDGASMVIVGSETRVKAALVEDLGQPGLSDGTEASESQQRRILAPSIGAILQAEDIGGWIRAEGVLVPQGGSMGNLDMRREKFDPVDDCDAEAYPLFV